MVNAPYSQESAAAAATIPPNIANPVTKALSDVSEKYAAERDKRARPDGLAQYIDLSKSDKFKQFQADNWVDYKAINTQDPPLKNGSTHKFLILGAGYGGLLFATRLVQAGISAKDIRLVDSAGGFGGTWYWNRYPGVMCDIESYIYMPLLEEMDYMPKHKYAYGPELREYANSIAQKFDLTDKAAFATTVQGMDWDDSRKQWRVSLKQIRGDDGQTIIDIQIHAQFVITASGLLLHPQIPNIPGIGNFSGHMFHTSRFDYKYTGGSPEAPILTNLQGKRVGVIGTGATAIQLVPELAKYAKELYVFQRTPSSVDVRGNHATDSSTWKSSVATQPGWQRVRQDNFCAFVSNATPSPVVNMVNDGWSSIPSYSALIGGPSAGGVTLEQVPTYLASLRAMDLVRSERVRARVDEVVQDKATASSLKAWYPTWCKRPCFHDHYLQSFNLPNVHLVDTDGKGVDRLTSSGIVANGEEYPLDVIVFSTGFRSPAVGGPGGKANIVIRGRNSVSLDEEWEKDGVATLHGVFSNGFPNLFFPGPLQIGVTANHISTMDQLAQHIAFVVTKCMEKVGATEKIVVEPSRKAQEDWSMQIVSQAATTVVMIGCTPGYLNREGEFEKPMSPEEQMKAAKGCNWREGFESFSNLLEKWRADGSLEGLEIQVV